MRIGHVQSKSDYPYFVGTGTLETTREDGARRVELALATEGWEILESGDVPFFLGSCVRARQG